MPEKQSIKKYAGWLIGVILLASTLLFFLGGPDYESPRSYKASWDLGHIAYFALLTLLICRFDFIKRLSPARQWTVIISVTFVLGTFIELLQYGTQREADILDVIRDLTGSALVLVFSPRPTATLTTRWLTIARSGIVLILLGLLTPLAISLTDETIARQQFPVLSDFNTPFEMSRWTSDAPISLTRLPAISQKNLLEISLTTSRYSGVILKYFPRDWRDYKMLNINLYQPEATPLRITCRIHDLQHTRGEQAFADRYNQSFTLAQGWNQITIDLHDVATAPQDRPMDMQQIHAIGLFTIELPRPRQLYLDSLYLSP